MNLYKNHTDRELIAVLAQSAKLTYDAQGNLLKELHARSLGVSTNELEDQLQEKAAAIEDFVYLKDLGFTYKKENTTQTISRFLIAKIMDVVSIVLGFILFVVGLVYFWLLMAMFFGENEFTLTKLFTYTLLITAGMIGFKMLSGIHRFLDYLSFSLVASGEYMTIRKGGLKAVQKMPVSDLTIETREGELILVAGPIEIMRCTEDNLVHKKTLEALRQKMIEKP